MVRRARLDAELVRRGLARSRSQAAELVVAGRVNVGGQVATKAATAIGPDDPLLVIADDDQPGYVSRGGRNSPARWPRSSRSDLEVAGRRCLDAGASTGRFHRRPAAGRRADGRRGRRRLRAARVVAAHRRASRSCRPHECARPHARHRSVRPSSWSSPTCRSSHSRLSYRP